MKQILQQEILFYKNLSEMFIYNILNILYLLAIIYFLLLIYYSFDEIIYIEVVWYIHYIYIYIVVVVSMTNEVEKSYDH